MTPGELSRGVRTDSTTGLLQRVWAELQGNRVTREIYSPPERGNFMIVPFHLKQVLGDRDEFGVPCTIFGVTRNGEIHA